MRRRSIPRPHPPLQARVSRRVRFEEVDQLSYMWHGYYASWLEDGRETLGSRYGISYLDFYAHGVAVPVKTLNIDYQQPLRYNVIYTIETSLLWNDAAVLEFDYRILDAENACMTCAHTTQLMIDVQGNLQLDVPDFYKAILQQWTQGTLA